ncbi:FG-GAP repeat protein [Streptomyces sp. NPDC047880]|uniref:FG-GAP repeat protein n=1 Tax=Streptomyces sp. NPDC047880 TaxID=3155626 RepID=UPI003452A138
MHQHLRTLLATAAAAALAGGLLTTTAGSAAALVPGAHGDFNGDGYRDFAVAAAGARVGERSGAGQVVIVYGGVGAPSSARTINISQNSPGVPGTAESGDGFGDAIVVEDFNGDGYGDLAVGAPGEDVGTDTDGGTVAILWGSETGLTSGRTINDPAPSSHDKFGRVLSALADSDGKPDLAIGSTTPTIDVYRGGFSDSGATGGSYRFVPPSWVTTAPVSMTAGNIGGGDVIADLVAIGSPDQDGGVVRVYSGADDAPSATPAYTITQDTPGIPGTSEAGDRFGASLAVSRAGYGYQNLAVGVPGESLGGATGTGAVTFLYGGPEGLIGARSMAGTDPQFFSQNSPGVAGSDESGDRFGGAVHIADTDNDRNEDLVVGAPGENSGDGTVAYLRSDGGIAPSGTPGITPAGTGVSTTGSPNFGRMLAG